MNRRRRFGPAAVYVAHPIQDRSADEMREIADGVFDALMRKLVAKG